MATNDKQLIGRTTLVTVGGVTDVPAKVGADSSCIWASDVQEVDDVLSFVLFGRASPYFSPQRITLGAGAYRRTRVASSSGHRQARYAVMLPIEISGVRMQVRFTLTNRETMVYPILLGRDMLADRFLVDVSQAVPVRLQEALKSQKRSRVHALKLAKSNEGAK